MNWQPVVGAIAIVLVSYILGYVHGEARGTHKGWVDGFIEQGRQARKRHRPNGQFASKEEITQ